MIVMINSQGQAFGSKMSVCFLFAVVREGIMDAVVECGMGRQDLGKGVHQQVLSTDDAAK